MTYSNQKTTARFTYEINRNDTSHKAGANTLTIATNPSSDSRYATGAVGLTMSVREAKVLQSFLNREFSDTSSTIPTM